MSLGYDLAGLVKINVKEFKHDFILFCRGAAVLKQARGKNKSEFKKKKKKSHQDFHGNKKYNCDAFPLEPVYRLTETSLETSDSKKKKDTEGTVPTMKKKKKIKSGCIA